MCEPYALLVSFNHDAIEHVCGCRHAQDEEVDRRNVAFQSYLNQTGIWATEARLRTMVCQLTFERSPRSKLERDAAALEQGEPVWHVRVALLTIVIK